MVEGPGPQGFKVSQLIVARSHTFHAGEYKCTPYTLNSHNVYIISGKREVIYFAFKEVKSLLVAPY